MNKWIQLSAVIDREYAEIAADYLQALDALAVHTYAASQEDVFGEDLSMQALWRKNYVCAIYPEDTDINSIIEQFQRWMNIPVDCNIEFIEEQDWVRLTQENFPPAQFGQLWVYPSWHMEDKLNPNITINPGLAFGTGTHPTTRLCLHYLAAHPPKNLDVIDYGCGSGILSIAAARLGAKHVIGVDHDPQAIEASNDNLSLNPDIVNQVQFYLDSKAPEHNAAALVIANIISGVLKQLREKLIQSLQPGGQLLLSGVLEEEATTIIDFYTAMNLELMQHYQDEEWCALLWKQKTS